MITEVKTRRFGGQVQADIEKLNQETLDVFAQISRSLVTPFKV